MRVLLAGATGVIGVRLIPMLLAQGHDVTGMTRDPEKTVGLDRAGVRPLMCDVFDREQLTAAVRELRPEVVIDELSDRPALLEPGREGRENSGNIRVRTEGTRNLVEAARAGGARRLIVQSYAHVYAPLSGWVKSEGAPLDLRPEAPRERREAVAAYAERERLALETSGIEGVALRYGVWYGPGTAYAPDGVMADLVRRRRYSIVSGGEGRTSFVHIDDAAFATTKTLDGPTGVFNLCDDAPATVSEWLPAYARALGAPAPRRVPPWALNVRSPDLFVYRTTTQRGASNQKAKFLLDFIPCYLDWRRGRQIGPDDAEVPLAA